MSPRPPDLAGVEDTIAAVSAVRHVLHAIRALARAQLAPVERLAAESTAWLDGVQQILDRLTDPSPSGRAPASGAAELVVVIGPERAFCGGLPRHVHEAVPAGPVALVGQRVIDLADEGLRARARFLLPGPASPDEVPDVARQIAEAVLASAPGRVVLVYPREAGPGGLHEALLLPGPRRVLAWLPDTYSAPEVVIEAAVRELATGRLAVALADTLRAEVRARLAAADAAVHAADARLRDLGQAARVQRQEQITREILEIVAARLATD